MNKMKLCIAISFAAHGLCMNAMQQQCTITDLPPPVIRRITGFIDERSDRKAFANTCRYLFATVATENKPLAMRCVDKKGILSVADFLDQVFTCIQHIVTRQGNNSIALDLEGNDLADDMMAVSTFLAKCSQFPIDRLALGTNKLIFLPEEIKGLIHLKDICLWYNCLGKKDLILLEKIINESLKRLKIVNIDNNKLLCPSDVYQTIAHCPLKQISAQGLWENWYSYKPTPEELKAKKADWIIL